MFKFYRPLNYTANSLLAAVVLVFSFSCALPAAAQTVRGAISGSFPSSRTIDSGVGVITQLAFDPNDENSLYVCTWNNGVRRYNYSEGGVISGGEQVVSSLVGLGGSAANSLTFLSGNPSFNPTSNGSYGIAFHDDPVLGSVMYLSRALNNVNNENPRQPGLGSIVRINDADGDGIWGGAGDLNQTIADNILAAQWTHQIDQFAIHGDTLYVAIGSLTSNGGVDYSGGADSDIGEAANSASVLFLEDLTLLSNDTTTNNVAYFDIGDDLNDPADVMALKTDTNVFTSTDPSKFRVYANGLRNCYGIAVDDSGTLWITNNEGGATASQGDELFRSSFQADHGFNKAGDAVGGDWRDPNNTNPSVQAAQNAGYFQTNVPMFADLGANTGVTGLDFLNAPGNPFDDYIVIARSGSGQGQDAVLVNPDTGAVETLTTGNFGQPTDILIDPYGDILMGSGQGQLAFIEVTGGASDPPLASSDIIDTTEPGLFGAGGISSFTSFTFGNGVTADINVVGVDESNGASLALDLNRAGIGVVNGSVGGTEILQFDFTNVQAPAGFTFVSFEFTAVLSQTRGTGGNGFVFASNDTADALVDGSLTAFAGSDISGDGVDQGSALLASDDGSPALAGNTFLFADNGGPVPFTTAIGIGNVRAALEFKPFTLRQLSSRFLTVSLAM